ncbi:MAG: calcium-binding protein [Pseudomonadota bacterium]
MPVVKIEINDTTDRYNGTALADTITGTNKIDWIYGKGGNDILSGSGNSDRIFGGSGNDAISGGPLDSDNADELNGGSGLDTISLTLGTANGHKIDGGKDNDTLRVSSATNLQIDMDVGFIRFINPSSSMSQPTKATFKSIEILYGSTSRDFIQGSDRADTIFGQKGADEIFGGSKKDTIEGGFGNDKIFGNDGNDWLLDGSSSVGSNQAIDDQDELRGGNGKDTLISMFSRPTEQDTLVGGIGDDFFYVEGAPKVRGGEGKDTLFADLSILGDPNRKPQTQANMNGMDANGGDGVDSLNFARVSANIATAPIKGLEINLKTGSGTDLSSVSFPVAFAVKNFENIIGTKRDDVLLGNGRKNEISGFGGDDKILGSGGEDKLLGEGGRDLIRGGDQKDVINGGAGRDELYGGGGLDRFRIGKKEGRDTIFDFDAKGSRTDTLDLREWNLTFKDLKIFNKGGDAFIEIRSNGTEIVVFDDPIADQLDKSDFLL